MTDSPPQPEPQAPGTAPVVLQVLLIWLVVCGLLPILVLALTGLGTSFFRTPFLLLAVLGGGLQVATVRLLAPRLAASPAIAQLVGFAALLLTAFAWLMPARGRAGLSLDGIEWVIAGMSLLGMATALGVAWRVLRPRLPGPAA